MRFRRILAAAASLTFIAGLAAAPIAAPQLAAASPKTVRIAAVGDMVCSGPPNRGADPTSTDRRYIRGFCQYGKVANLVANGRLRPVPYARRPPVLLRRLPTTSSAGTTRRYGKVMSDHDALRPATMRAIRRMRRETPTRGIGGTSARGRTGTSAAARTRTTSARGTSCR